MADASSGNGAGAAPQETQAPRLQIVTQFTRDLSFENVAAQKGFTAEGKPEIKVQVNLDAQKRAEDQYEVGLKVKINSTVAEQTIFILELDYAGRFTIQHVAEAQLHPLLLIECPRLLFPFVRRIVADATRDGGYPPVNLDVIDFLALYRQEVARRQAEAKPAAPVS